MKEGTRRIHYRRCGWRARRRRDEKLRRMLPHVAREAVLTRVRAMATCMYIEKR
jgi:hypothetical protein